MLAGKIDIRVFDNHINHTYHNDHYVQIEWQRIKNEIIALAKQSASPTNTASASCPKQLCKWWCSFGLMCSECLRGKVDKFEAQRT